MLELLSAFPNWKYIYVPCSQTTTKYVKYKLVSTKILSQTKCLSFSWIKSRSITMKTCQLTLHWFHPDYPWKTMLFKDAQGAVSYLFMLMMLYAILKKYEYDVFELRFTWLLNRHKVAVWHLTTKIKTLNCSEESCPCTPYLA